MKSNITGAAAILACLVFAACSSKKAKEKKPPTYPILTIAPQKAVTYNDYPATIQGKEVVEIRPMVDGYLEKIFVPEGADVVKGQLLFKITAPQYEQAVITALAAIKSAQADVDAAKMDVDKVNPLVQKQIVSKYELESAQYTLKSKEAALSQANATLANAKTNLGYTMLMSPANGVISSIPYKIGALVSSTTTNPLTVLSNIDTVYAYFSLNEKQLLSFSQHIPGNTLKDKVDRLPPVNLLLADGSTYKLGGKMETASGLIATETGTASFKARFANPEHTIRSGASGNVRITRTIDSAMLIPQSATYELQDKTFVYELIAGNKIVSAPVTVSPSSAGQFVIVTSGLRMGDKVLLNGFNIKDSTVVIPKPVNADSLYRAATTN